MYILCMYNYHIHVYKKRELVKIDVPLSIQFWSKVSEVRKKSYIFYRNGFRGLAKLRWRGERKQKSVCSLTLFDTEILQALLFESPCSPAPFTLAVTLLAGNKKRSPAGLLFYSNSSRPALIASQTKSPTSSNV